MPIVQEQLLPALSGCCLFFASHFAKGEAGRYVCSYFKRIAENSFYDVHGNVSPALSPGSSTYPISSLGYP